MSLSIDTAVLSAQMGLEAASARLQKSMGRLASGTRIVSADDDAGGLAVSMKLGATATQLGAVTTNLENGHSFLRAQEGAMTAVAKALTRIEELTVLMRDSTKNSSDLRNYRLEVENLKSEIVKTSDEKFNGIRLFSPTSEADYIDVDTSPLQSGPLRITRPSLARMVTRTSSAKKFRRDVTMSFDQSNVSAVGRDYLNNRPKDLINSLGVSPGVPGAGSFGEIVVNSGDDNSSDAVDITPIFGPNGINFDGRNVRNIFVNNNGNITFGSALSTYTPNSVSAGDLAIIAPFWADVDTRAPQGVAYGPANSSPGGNSTGTNRVYCDVDADNRVLTVTWDDVRFFNNQSAGGNPENRVNAFQLQLIDSGNGNAIIMFRYENIDWTTGGASGGSNGLGGNVARVGFNSGAGGVSIELPQSGRQQDILDLDQNLPSVGFASGRPGVYIFEIRNGHFSPIDESETVTTTETTGEVTVTLDQIVGYIAQNGAKQTAFGLLKESSELKRVNIEAARSRIIDTDVATETQQLVKARILQQISAIAIDQSRGAQKSILQIIENLRA